METARPRGVSVTTLRMMGKAGAQRTEEGFTFAEVLIALLIVALATGVIASAIVQVLRSEQRARDLKDATLQLQTLVCRAYLYGTGDRDLNDSLPSGWQTDRNEHPMGDTSWTTWSVQRKGEGTAYRHAVAIRTRSTPWK